VKTDPLAPIGSLRVLAGPRTDDATVPVAIDLYGDDEPGEIEMLLRSPGSRSPEFEAYARQALLPLATVTKPSAQLLAVTLRDAAGNESLEYTEEILVYPPNSLGSVRGTVQHATGGPAAGVLVHLADSPFEPGVVGDLNGYFVLNDLVPGTYAIELALGDLAGRVENVVVSAGGETDLGVVMVPEPGALLAASAASAAIAALAGMRRRRRARA
jgi:hypothetical protein